MLPSACAVRPATPSTARRSYVSPSGLEGTPRSFNSMSPPPPSDSSTCAPDFASHASGSPLLRWFHWCCYREVAESCPLLWSSWAPRRHSSGLDIASFHMPSLASAGSSQSEACPVCPRTIKLLVCYFTPFIWRFMLLPPSAINVESVRHVIHCSSSTVRLCLLSHSSCKPLSINSKSVMRLFLSSMSLSWRHYCT